ncbi:nicotinate-nucleotide adenylyltransferase [Lactococcus garvieae]|jgi:nicotinate-nucleotide adenylyltransferase|uniref:Probable nicotinate-nucleotide adenylyltransferase n=4 Tax=Bacillota TaxID=1239 RepID=F9VD90_LACGL|nr:nicotinate-nucleotide adenylyltransferase [Lactococcus garvieae]ETD05201.1 nicotinic acid mononucleotide adenylyltransferase [Lactococcus garvieae TRF1]MDN5629860.1 nicotinate-nucleotide adenylyltransferase [Lactococcus sp.]EIT66335.1 Putative nicotinate-nucleotide adenylyltransferase 1 [Lactococcus garvieae IPLA 31405]EOT32606.1 nicotinate (nicotinamide) nucleotide adenylyltransferase [Lactococcus garvieae ATCC 49156]EOT93636.1 nicotinate (nicotinamide) nucleotide adenylyltransferase [Lact
MEQVKRNKIGILGGNFNPVHFTHLMMADQVAQRLELDKVWLMPEALPPHVDEKKTISAEHRVKMLELAIADSPRLSLELGEVARGGKSYTYDTMKHLTQAYPDTDFYFIIGSDMVEYLPKWYKIEALLDLVQFVAVQRSTTAIESPYPVQWVDLPLSFASSTSLRQMFKDGIEPAYLMPRPVIDYIKKNKLYLEG